jgi:hypothetical protein
MLPTSQGRLRMKTMDWATGRDEKALKKLVASACVCSEITGSTPDMSLVSHVVDGVNTVA